MVTVLEATPASGHAIGHLHIDLIGPDEAERESREETVAGGWRDGFRVATNGTSTAQLLIDRHTLRAARRRDDLAGVPVYSMAMVTVLEGAPRAATPSGTCTLT